MSRDVLAAQARQLIEAHGDDWDSPHVLVTLHPDGDDGLRAGTLTMITLDVDPATFPGLMEALAARALAEHPASPPYAYGLCIEGFGMVMPAPGASRQERELFERARATRTICRHPDATESASAWIADIHGRAWLAMLHRGASEIREEFYPADSGRIGGTLVTALVQVAVATGIAAWGTGPMRAAGR